MAQTLYAALLGLVVAGVAASLLLLGNDGAQARCELSHSASTCAYALR